MIDEKIVRSKGFIKHQLRKNNAGFTLVELIIVISVISMLSVVGIVAFASYSRAQTLNAAAGDLAVMLNLAKSRAYSQIKISNAFCIDATSLEGYEVKICNPSCTGTPEGTSFALYMRCGGDTKVSTANFSNSNLTFSSPIQPSVYSFFFPVLKGGVVGSGTITISNSFTETRMVTVDASGNIRIEK